MIFPFSPGARAASSVTADVRGAASVRKAAAAIISKVATSRTHEVLLASSRVIMKTEGTDYI